MEEKKKSKIAVAQLVLTAVILAVMLIVGVTFVVSVASIRKDLVVIEQDLEQIDMNQVNKTIKAMEGAASSLENLDMDSVNSIISQLDHAAETISNIATSIGSIFK